MRMIRTENLTFGEALERLKSGMKLARAGWNGKGMFVWLNKGGIDRDDMSGNYGGVPLHLFERSDHGTVTRMPNINMRAADGSTVTGWLASQTDMLAEDWTVVS